MMLFTNDYIPDGETRQTMGLVTIAISAVNFGANGIPIFVGFKVACRQKAIEKKRKAEQQKKDMEKLKEIEDEEIKKIYEPTSIKRRIVMARIKDLENQFQKQKDADQLQVIPEEADEGSASGSAQVQAKTRPNKKGKKLVRKVRLVRRDVAKKYQQQNAQPVVEAKLKAPSPEYYNNENDKTQDRSMIGEAEDMFMIRTDQPGSRPAHKVEKDVFEWIHNVE